MIWVLAIAPVTWGLVLAVAALVGGIAFFFWLLLRGALTVDLGWGRSIHPLGPLEIRITAPRELVFEQISSPYLGRTPRELRTKLEVLERGGGMAVAAHHTKLRGFTATTVESVTFEPPERIGFRLLRGPVPYVVESFVLREVPGGTELSYQGELGADLWFLGRLSGRLAAKIWVRTVAASMETIRTGAEERAARGSRRRSTA